MDKAYLVLDLANFEANHPSVFTETLPCQHAVLSQDPL